MRIDKLLSVCSLATRSEAGRAAKAGRITVNGVAEKNTARQIDPEKDIVCFDGVRVIYREHVYIMLNKPEGYVSATEDGRDPTVLELIPDEARRAGMFPCGRLDRDNQTITGLQATRFLSDINIDIALLSPSGLSARSGFTVGNYSECELKRIVVEKARLVIILMDSSKIDKSLPYTFCTFENIDVLITSSALPYELAALAEANGVRVINVEEENK